MRNLPEDLDVYVYRKGLPAWMILFVPIIYPASWPIIIYRFGAWGTMRQRRWVRIFLYIVYFPLKRLVEILTSIDISERAVIGPGLYLAHIGSIVIGHGTEIGAHASVHQGVTLGGDGFGKGFPKLGDRVYIGAGAKIIGGVEIGHDVMVGANAVVIDNIPDNAIAGGIPARVLRSHNGNLFVHFRNQEKRFSLPSS